jgi:hypothetical protein
MSIWIWTFHPRALLNRQNRLRKGTAKNLFASNWRSGRKLFFVLQTRFYFYEIRKVRVKTVMRVEISICGSYAFRRR